MAEIEQLERVVADLVRTIPESDADTVDLAGRVNAVAVQLQTYKRSLLSELGVVSGSLYRQSASRKGSRSYNTAGIVHAFNEKGIGLGELVRIDAARIAWQWTKLNRAMADYDIPLVLVRHEITDDGDLEGALVGETWSDTYALEAVKE